MNTPRPLAVDYEEAPHADRGQLVVDDAREERRRAAIAEKIALERLKRLPGDGTFVEVNPMSEAVPGQPMPVTAWLSREFVVLLYEEQSEGTQRLSVGRSRAVRAVREPRRDRRPITWEELQAAKRGVGLGAVWALELYPSEDHVVDVTGMRHLWLVGEPPPFGWRREPVSPHVDVAGATAR